MSRCAWVAAGAAVAVLTACSSGATPEAPRSTERTVSVAPVRPSASLPFGRVATPGVANTSSAAATVSPPVHVRIPAIGVDTPLVRLGLAKDGSLEAPVQWQRAGWYTGGTVPGQVGPAVIAGHIDSVTGPAIFFKLGELRRGDKVFVTRQDRRTLTFVVDGADTYAKARFPTSTVYAATPDPQLRLITCAGRFDAADHNYLSNLVVSAHLIS